MRAHHDRDLRPDASSMPPGSEATDRPARAGRFGVRPNKPKKTGWRRLVPRPRTALLSVLCALVLLMAALIAGYLWVDIPDPNKQAKQQSNVWLYADGTEIGRSGAVHRNNVKIDQISLAAQRATLAAEHRNFYKDPAISVMGISRALFNNVKGGATQGGSTITQQYVKNYYLNQDVSFARKFNELFISLKIDKKLSKDEILAGYLNTSYYGRGAYGIEAAAQSYFGTDAKNLTASQGAYLATLLNAPGLYDVKQNPKYRDKAVARWNYVMDGMRTMDWLTPAERASAVFPEPLDPKPSKGMSGQNGYLIHAARQYLISSGTVTEAQLDAGGWQITTTLDKNKQQDLVKAVDNQLRSQLRPEIRAADRDARVGAASVENGTGKVVALYGGPDYVKQFINDATRRDIQAGSTFKAFALAAALENKATDTKGRRITPDSIYNGNNGYRATNGYAPGNQGGVSYGDISLRTAMARSVNTVFAQLAQDAGLPAVRDAAVAAGLNKDTPDLSTYPSLPLGVATPSALDMASAYATFADHGTHHSTRLVTSLNRAGDEHPLPSAEKTRAFSDRTADTVTDVLRSTVDSPAGTASAARALGRPAAGKTGTTNEKKSVWFVGYTPQLTTAVTVFREDPDSHARLSVNGLGGNATVGGGTFPAKIWTAYTKAALSGTPVEYFSTPHGTDTGKSGKPGGSDLGKDNPRDDATPTPTHEPTPPSSPAPSTTPPAPSPEPTRTPHEPGGPGGPGADDPPRGEEPEDEPAVPSKPPATEPTDRDTPRSKPPWPWKPTN
ncbi:transglycosylase domain-containing protein [Streptomyces sp. NPDC091376]|uniref:transglycosylase domain-containing protein n=1 Tax=Streptomyces sp. NPDC091376 TaxID=3365994 RepID=UPI00381D5556